jgi:hypothetical protein
MNSGVDKGRVTLEDINIERGNLGLSHIILLKQQRKTLKSPFVEDSFLGIVSSFSDTQNLTLCKYLYQV